MRQLHVKVVISLIWMATLITSGNASYAAHTKPAVWFAPESHYPSPAASDLMQSFEDPHEWQQVLDGISVFQLSSQFFTAAPQKVVDKAVQFLGTRGIALAVAAEFTCGQASGTPEIAAEVIQKIKIAGGKISYIVMDEPFWWVHASNTKFSCMLNMQSSLNHVVSITQPYVLAFPDVVIGDVEPFPAITDSEKWQTDLGVFYNDLGNRLRKRVEFFQLDINWREKRILSPTGDDMNVAEVRHQINIAENFAGANHLEFGVIANGRADAQSSAEWVAQAKEHLALLETTGRYPDQILFESWHKFPEKISPETDPASFSGYIASFLNRKRQK